jgi:archaeosine-15-forming tRNA-guanine transglycosylase
MGGTSKTKLAAVLDYKYGMEITDQMLSHHSFERKTIKL